jgi:tRNA pseudouridine13 synthase
MYTLKQIPEDFVVNEVSKVKTSSDKDYGYFIMKKRDYSTHSAAEKIADFLGIPVKFVGYAGNKDRKAVTTQLISVKGPHERIKNFKSPNIELEFKGTGKEPISLGELEGNNFEIVVRNIKKAPKKIKKFINYFDEQRFSNNNAEIGRAIIKKEFKKAVQLILKNKGEHERNVGEHDSNDAVGALRSIPKKVLRLYVHAYQSYLWNLAAEKLSKTNKNIEIPLVGFGTDIKDKKANKIIEEIMDKENMTQRDFIIKSIPELSSEGSSRKLYAEIKNLKVGKLESDELNKGMKKVKIKFLLDKGCYATMAVKSMF